MEFLAGELGMTAEVEVGAAVDAFEFFETEWELELDVGSGVGIVAPST